MIAILLGAASSNQVEGEKGLVASGGELGSESVSGSCVRLELGSILNHENQRDTEESRQRGSMTTRGRSEEPL